jgi:hypothetical protein
MENEKPSEMALAGSDERGTGMMKIGEDQSALIREQHQAFLLKITLIEKLRENNPHELIILQSVAGRE